MSLAGLTVRHYPGRQILFLGRGYRSRRGHQAPRPAHRPGPGRPRLAAAL